MSRNQMTDSRSAFAGFIRFIREQGVVGLAVGFILGGAVAKIVSSLVSDVIMPLIGLLLGSTSGMADFKLGPVRIGNFLSVTVDFVIVAAVVYFIVKGLRLDSLDSKGGEKLEEAKKDAMKEPDKKGDAGEAE